MFYIFLVSRSCIHFILCVCLLLYLLSVMCLLFVFFFFFKQKTAYEMRISDWSSDVCSSDLRCRGRGCRGRIGIQSCSPAGALAGRHAQCLDRPSERRGPHKPRSGGPADQLPWTRTGGNV